MFWVLICTVHFILSSCHVTYAFHSASTLYICLNFKELLARSRFEIWRWSDCNWSRTQNHLVLRRTLNHLAKLGKGLNCVLRTYLYGAFDCMLLSCHIPVSEWLHTLYLPQCQGTPCSKQARNLKVRWLQRDSNPEPLSSLTNTQPFGQTGQMLELCSEYFSVRCIWLYILVMPRTPFRVNPHSIFALMSRNSLLEAGTKCEGEVTATKLETTTTLFLNEHSTIWSNWPNDWAVFWVLNCTVHLTVYSCHVMYASHGEYTLYIWLNVKELLAQNRREIWRWSDCNGTRTQNHLVLKRTLNHWPNWTNDSAVFWVLICTVHLTVYSCHATYAFQSESTLYIRLNVKELLVQSSREICRWSDCNCTQTQNHLVLKRTLNHLVKLAK